jgi:hypothetical protein
MKKVFSSDKVLSISAIIIALASIFISVWEGFEIRKHNRLSVRPKLEISYNVAQDNFGYVLTNNGLGPAIIMEKKLFIDNTEIKSSGFSGYDEFFEVLNLKDRLIMHGATGSGITIRPSKNENIFVFKFVENEDKEKLISQIYNRVRIEISYKSMYDESFICKVPSS